MAQEWSMNATPVTLCGKVIFPAGNQQFRPLSSEHREVLVVPAYTFQPEGLAYFVECFV